MRKTGATMKIKDLFQKDIHRKIEEVIKVDQADQETVKNELEEYIVTDSIKSARINNSYTLLVLLLVFCVVSKLT